MSIDLNQEDRAQLERLQSRRAEPTQRQKAIALLRLAAGMSPAQAAESAGIPKEQVESLAAEFAASGLVGVGLAVKPKTRVRLVRPGVGVKTYRLPKGATISDLLRRSGTTTTNQVVYVDGQPSDGTTLLCDGAIVMIVPKVRNAAIEKPWHATIPSFQDETLYKEYNEILKTNRHTAASEEDPEA